MNILQTIYMNFFTIGALIAFIMYLLAALFLLTIPKKTSATFYVGLTLLIMSFLCLGYFIAAFFYVESAAYHRWLTVASSLFAAIPAMQVFFHYPVLIKPKLARIIQIIQWVYNIAIVGYFIQATYGAPTVYHFDGHYWDFDRDKPSAFVAYFILLNVAAFIGVAIWRIIVTKTHERWVVLGILLSFMTITVIPGALNSLSREGAMDRGTFSTLFDLLTVLGTFSLVIIYINNTKDRTTFMAKIVGVSLVVALLILQAMSYFFINEREDSYDGVHREMTARVLLDKSRPEDMDYIVEFSKADRTFNILRGSWISSDFENLRAEFLNTALRDSIESLPDESFSENLKPLLKSAHSSFAGYAALLRKFDEEMPRSEKNRGRGIFEKIDGMKYTLLYRYNKIQKIPDSDFRNGLTVFLRGQGGSFAPFKSAMEYHLTLSRSEGTELKREILEFVSAVKPQGARHYRESENGRATAFMKVDGIAGKIYEAGYSYERYRAFIHPAGLKLTIMLACILVVVLVGFQFFFLGALISPLNALLEGVRRVNDNDLEARVPVKVEDEIGFISRSFNKMVRSILAARKKLQEYAETLEEKVKQRTAELQATLDQVQSLKTQQDGDYFLTSLLIRPFAMNRSTEGPVHVEFLVKQKKQFEFRKWRDFPKRKLVSPFFDAKAKGSLHFSGPGKKFSMKFKDASGMQGHNWGSEHSHRYVWAHCNTLRDEKNSGSPAVFEGFSGKIKVGPFITPHLTGLFLKPDAEFAAQYGISCFDLLAVNRYLNKTVSVDESNMTWDWTADYNPIRIAGKFKADRGSTAGLKYFDPDGKLHYCYNSKKAECSISLIHRKSNIVLREYHSSSCALEFLTDLEFKEMILF